MSYILEALKKAQAERQLGSTPGLDALSIQAGVQGGAARSIPLWGALGAVSLVAVVAVAMLLWRQGGAPTSTLAPVAKVPSQIAESAPMPVSAPAVVAMPAPAAVAAPASAPVPAPMPLATPLTATPPAATAPTKVAATPPATRAVASAAAAAGLAVTSTPTSASTSAPAPARPPAREATPLPAPAAATAPLIPPVIDEGVASARELPDAIQRQLPKVVFGGYIYSKNPEDRLLLVDKVLRHEGEEVAPGLTLERLLPKAAVMNFKGYRYRVAY